MLTLYHSPASRSSRILSLIFELGIEDRINIQTVQIARKDGSVGADPKNPHPDAKVPMLDHDGILIRESTAIALYLTDLFPKAGIGPQVADPLRGPYLSWLAWYSGVLEPVLVHRAAGLDHPILTATFRTDKEALNYLTKALENGPWLLGDRFSAADIIVHAPFAWFPDLIADNAAINDWVQSCTSRPAAQKAIAQDAQT